MLYPDRLTINSDWIDRRKDPWSRSYVSNLTEANLGPYTRDQFGRFSEAGLMSPDRDTGSGIAGKKLPVKPLPKKLPVVQKPLPKKLPTKKVIPNSESKVVSGHVIYRVHYEDPYPKPQPPPSVPRNASIEEKRARKPFMEAHRIELAQWENAVAARGGHWFFDDGKPAPRHIQEYGLSPTDIDVFVNPDPTGHLVAHGWHQKADGSRADKPFHRYAKTHVVNRVVTKHARSHQLLEHAEALFDQVDQDSRSSDPVVRDSAIVLRLILQTGQRIGNPESRRGHMKAVDVIDPSTGEPLRDADGKKVKETVLLRTHGVSTLEARHVQVAPKTVTKTQTGDEGGETAVTIRKGQTYLMYMVEKANRVAWFPIDDEELSAELLSRKAAAADSRDLIFPSTDNSRVLKYIKEVGRQVGINNADKLKTKDLRGAVATSVAIRTREEVMDRLFGQGGRPQTQADFNRFIDALSAEAARVLKNTPGVCRKSYLNWPLILEGQMLEEFDVPLMESLETHLT